MLSVGSFIHKIFSPIMEFIARNWIFSNVFFIGWIVIIRILTHFYKYFFFFFCLLLFLILIIFILKLNINKITYYNLIFIFITAI